MEKTARAILKYNDKYILMRRKKYINGKIIEYYTTIGGHLDDGESYEEACIREIYEELGVVAKITKLLCEYENKDLNRYEKFYWAEIESGVLGTGKGEEFCNVDFEKYGSFEIAYLDKEKIDSINLLPEFLKKYLKDY